MIFGRTSRSTCAKHCIIVHFAFIVELNMSMQSKLCSPDVATRAFSWQVSGMMRILAIILFFIHMHYADELRHGQPFGAYSYNEHSVPSRFLCRALRVWFSSLHHGLKCDGYVDRDCAQLQRFCP